MYTCKKNSAILTLTIGLVSTGVLNAMLPCDILSDKPWTEGVSLLLRSFVSSKFSLLDSVKLSEGPRTPKSGIPPLIIEEQEKQTYMERVSNDEDRQTLGGDQAEKLYPYTYKLVRYIAGHAGKSCPVLHVTKAPEPLLRSVGLCSLSAEKSLVGGFHILFSHEDASLIEQYKGIDSGSETTSPEYEKVVRNLCGVIRAH